MDGLFHSSDACQVVTSSCGSMPCEIHKVEIHGYLIVVKKE